MYQKYCLDFSSLSEKTLNEGFHSAVVFNVLVIWSFEILALAEFSTVLHLLPHTPRSPFVDTAVGSFLNVAWTNRSCLELENK